MKNKHVLQLIQKFFLLTGSSITLKQSLRRPVHIYSFIVAFVFCSNSLVSCEKDINIKIKDNHPLLVVEGYINNLLPQYNYVALSRSLDFFSTDFQSTAVSNATVTITEGEFINNQYVWNTTGKVQLYEANLPFLPVNFRHGVYFDPRLILDPPNALAGKVKKYYLLEISEGGNQYSAITRLLNPVKIDSLTKGFSYVDTDDENKTKYRITNHYKDPDTLNNTQLYYYRFSENRDNFGWGGISRTRSFGADDLTNGQEIHLTHQRGFAAPDTVDYYMASVTRDVFNFWDSFNKARNNNGPFSTPVTLISNIKGSNVTGCFTGLSLDAKTIIISK